MDSLDVSYLAAAAGGLLSFFSPCVLPLVLPFLAWCGGVDLAGDVRQAPRQRAWGRTLAFVLGFVTMFVGFGAAAGLIGARVGHYLEYASIVAGGILVVVGLHVAGVLSVRSFDLVIRFPQVPRASGPLSAYLVGLTFAFGWSPCVGPILAAILTLAGTGDSVTHGTGLLAVYGATMAAPFFLAAAFARRFERVVRSSARVMPFVRWSSAVLIIATGLGIMTGTFWRLGFWMLRIFPVLAAFAR